MEEKVRSLALMQETHEAQMKEIVGELDKERSKLASLQTRLQGTHLFFEDPASVTWSFD